LIAVKANLRSPISMNGSFIISCEIIARQNDRQNDKYLGARAGVGPIKLSRDGKLSPGESLSPDYRPITLPKRANPQVRERVPGITLER
jgi:hypothetical protein